MSGNQSFNRFNAANPAAGNEQQGTSNREGVYNTNFGQNITESVSVDKSSNQINSQQIILSDRLSTRYDRYRGILGNSQDMRASLILNSVEDNYRYSGIEGDMRINRLNLHPANFNDDTANKEANFLGVADVVLSYLGELKNLFSNKNLTSDAVAAYRAIKTDVASSVVASPELLALNILADNLVQEINGQLSYRDNAFENLLTKLSLDATKAGYVEKKGIKEGSLYFKTFMVGKLALQKFLEATEADNRAKVTPVADSSKPQAVEPENIFFRKVGQPGKIFTIAQNGEAVQVQAGSNIYEQLNPSVQCFGTGLSGNEAKCNEYFMKCLAGSEVKSCREFMESSTFWQNAESAVSSMLPDVLLRTLKSFGFQPFTSKTSTGRSYSAYPSAEQWIETLEATLGDDDAAKTVQSVRNNSKLMGYLNMIVTRVNANPGIANPTYVEDGPAFNPNAFAGTLGAKYGVRGKAFAPRKNFARAPPAPSAVSALENTVVNFMSPLGISYGIMPVGTAFGQMGGAWEFDVSTEKNLPLQVSGHLDSMYESILENLQGGGKDLDAGDQQTIKKMVNELNVLENKLFKSASYVQGYEDLLAVNQQGGGIISESNLEKFTAKRNDYFNRVNAKYQSIFPIFSKLAEACEKETLTAGDVITAASYPKA